METNIKKKLLIPFFTFLVILAVGINDLYKGVVHHETWRIVLASLGGLGALFFIVIIIYAVIMDKRKALAETAL